ncbi:hypothetical protein [Nocardia aurantia]|uniref:Uncharacterized protein n=1 Tax=Nocardia aurantia TaxID=2585199 RepID=A0A7K0DZZ6_9NOCA|nr:hypothetical protein [Nocardia aurantia]MQY31221.1 hypothetical protein [Nocardia aurantia]
MLFDIRTIVGALLGLYGIILTVTGLVHDTASDQDRTGGWNINLWAGIGLIVVSILFLAWARLRPVVERRAAGDGDAAVPADPGTLDGEPGTPNQAAGEPDTAPSRPADQPGTPNHPAGEPGTGPSRSADQPGTTPKRPGDEPGTTSNRLSE